MLIGSGLGLAIPATRKTPNSITRRHLRNRSWVVAILGVAVGTVKGRIRTGPTRLREYMCAAG
jgi:hypothetical protein